MQEIERMFAVSVLLYAFRAQSRLSLACTSNKKSSLCGIVENFGLRLFAMVVNHAPISNFLEVIKKSPRMLFTGQFLHWSLVYHCQCK